jgi:HAD superfamily hydrolase (TIGR01549 family)
MKHPLIDAVVFDLWNTLITADYEGVMAEYRRVLGAGFDAYHLQAMTALQLKLHPSLDDYLDEALAPTGYGRGTPQWQRIREVTAGNVASATAFPETFPVLEDLRRRGYRLGMLSNASTPYREPIDTLGMRPYFDSVCVSCERGLMKPDQAFFRLTSAELQVPAERCLMIGDSNDYDISGALRSRMWAIRIDHKPSPVPSLPGVPVITTLDALRKL